MSDIIKWCQLSDLHTFDETTWNLMKTKYISKLKKENVNFLVITGDLHQYNKPYDLTLSFLNELVEELHLDKKDVFIIPGNHDCDHAKAERTEEVSVFIRSKIEEDPDKYNSRKDTLLSKYDGYKRFLEDFYGSSNYSEYEKILDGYNLFVWKNKLNILCINSTYICDGTNHEQILDTYKLSKIEVRNNLPLIACMHHHIYDIFDKHKSVLNSVLTNNNASAIFCGDKHLTSVVDDSNNYPNSFCCPCIVCPKSSSQNSDTFSDLGYIIYNWSLSSSQVTYEIFSWDKRLNRFFPNPIFKKENDKSLDFQMKHQNLVNASTEKSNTNPKNKGIKKATQSSTTLWSVTGEMLVNRVRNMNLAENNDLLNSMSKVLIDSEDNSVKQFIENSQHSFSFLYGLKGNGKTLCITLKRYAMQKNNVVCIPKDDVLANNGSFQINTELISGLEYDDNNMAVIQDFITKIKSYWELAIYLSIIQAFHEFDISKDIIKFEKDIIYFDNKQFVVPNEIKNDIITIIKKETAYTPIEMMMLVLKWPSTTVDSMNRECPNVIRTISKRLRECDQSLAIFIDAVDQMTFDYNKKIPPYISKRIGEIFQIALLRTHGITRNNIHLYFTMRQEVYLAYTNDYNFKNRENIAGEIRLSYSKRNLEDLYQTYIFNDRPQYRIDKNISKSIQKNTDLLSIAFVGSNEILNRITQTKESLFDYLYRHTFRRARDLTKLCQQLAIKIEVIKRSDDRAQEVKDTIDKYIQRDDFSYLKEYVNELLAEWQCYGLFDKEFLSLFPSDILSKNQIDKLRQEYKNIHKDEYVLDPFDVLYRLGLLGYFEKKGNDRYDHKLIPVTSIRTVTEECSRDAILPDNACFYTLHTVLSKLISVYRSNFRYSKRWIINSSQQINHKTYKQIKYDINRIEKM